jgi:hypothetical protein
MNYITPLFQILSILSLFLIDVSGIMLFKQLLLQTVLCFYIARLFHQPALMPLLMAALCIHLEWFIMYDSLSLATLFLVPITALVFYLKRVLIPRIAYPPIILLLCMAIQTWLTYTYTAHQLPHISYTIAAIIANIIVLLSNSLIW